MAMHLDDNERALLLGYMEVDPEAENWTAPWVPEIDMVRHGADMVAASFDGRIAVARRLAQRKLLEGDPKQRGKMRGYAITAKGKEAVK